MIQVFLYLISFLTGVFVIWKLGRDEYYDEEKLIDLTLLCAVIGLFTARLGYFLFPVGREQLVSIFDTPGLGVKILRFFQLNSGGLWWFGIGFYFIAAFWLLRRWRWPAWPMLGILGLGLSTTIILRELFFWYWHGFSYYGVVLIGAILTTLILGYLLKIRQPLTAS